MRTGTELIRATKPFAEEDLRVTWRETAATFLVLGATFAVAVSPAAWPSRLAASILQGLVTVRLFILFHDYHHGAIFRGSRLGKWVMGLAGLYFLTPDAVWRETHNYHHKNNVKLVGSSIGSYPVVSVDAWRRMPRGQRVLYALARHPLNMLFGYFTVFIAGMLVRPAARGGPHRRGVVFLAVHAASIAGLVYWGGWATALLGLVLPVFIATAAGSYLFYAQHNFPGIELRDRAEWDYVHAALRCSSMFEMGPLMHWFTGNIGYHHVHHLNHRIPFYRLPEAMAQIPELQAPVRTSWRPRDVWACLRLRLWDPRQARMVTFSEARGA